MFFPKLFLFSACIFHLNYCFEEQPNLFLTAAKSVPRIGRSNKDTTDFEKFFLKASKSVPRIGRRNDFIFFHSINSNFQNRYDEIEKTYMQPKNFKFPSWTEIADRYEHDPELFSNPQILYEMEKMLGDDPNAYEWNEVRTKRG
ncbi:unnamed protein product [Phyllotreta striolata]|uniref:Uncharacterized protein n=1 Tax=Phyllotreta striolata TaxID=444603 RepID=A0A9N9XMP2_PHYSR|nr:unnamed protein product [Phyllotreta striolata]